MKQVEKGVKAESQAMIELTDLISRVTPSGKFCKVCHGQRGWFSITQTTVDGVPRYTLNICCGKVGDHDAVKQHMTNQANGLHDHVEQRSIDMMLILLGAPDSALSDWAKTVKQIAGKKIISLPPT